MKRTLENIKDPLFRFFEREVSFPGFCDLISPIYEVRIVFAQFWKVMDIDIAIFQDLESFGKGRFFKVAMKKFWIVVWGKFVCATSSV